jgi:riboflavin kinase / FMN adenylyltransferase
MVQHLTSLDGVNLQHVWLTIGSFDGVHLGHQELIRELNKKAHEDGSLSVVLSFYPHPAVVLRGKKGPFYLTTPDERAILLDELGTDVVITHPFTSEIAQTSAHDFIEYLKSHLVFQQLWVGNDFALGHGREGNVDTLKLLGKEFGYLVQVIQPVVFDGQKVSSSQIRNLIFGGNIERANKLLGRAYRLSGVVVHGDGRGRLIGIPTANLEINDEKLIPGAGVYACKAEINGKQWQAAVNIGIRPTFDSPDQLSHVEAHLLDYSQDLYGQQIYIDFISRLRGEQRFPSVQALIDQVHSDIEQTRKTVIVNPQI